ncbi:hypothetical protein IFM89_002035 [Coptis chinensis]|uniref:Uncharacterized protein n=1 Tax=Coptis chinensis TaxID=261450 RepID=A0A835LAN8_9MAGN|nr:hypothetical protein IFM89_002035 [Coptis chinensis]
MKNSVSDQKFYIESEEDEEKVSSDKGDDVNGYNSDSSSTVSSIESEQHNRPCSYNTSWPQSYRLIVVACGWITHCPCSAHNLRKYWVLGSPSLSKISSSFLSSSLTRRHTPEILSSLIKPLLPVSNEQQEEQQHQRRSSHSLLPPLPTKRSFIKKAGPEQQTHSKVTHEVAGPRQCSYGQAVLNGK